MLKMNQTDNKMITFLLSFKPIQTLINLIQMGGEIRLSKELTRQSLKNNTLSKKIFTTFFYNLQISIN